MAEISQGLYTVGFYAGLLGLVAIWLGAHVGKTRGQVKIFMGDGGNPQLIRAMRGQGNFTENVPLTLVFLTLMALLGTPVWVLHTLGVMLVVGRILHAVHFCANDAPAWQRAVGFGLSFLVLVVSTLGLIAHGALNAF